jgi:hypothetical protein
MQAAWEGYQQVNAIRTAVKVANASGAPAEVATAATAFLIRLDEVGGATTRNRFGGGGNQRALPPTFSRVNGQLAGVLGTLETGDMAPNESVLRAAANACGELTKVSASWRQLRDTELTAFNAVLTKKNLKPVAAAPALAAPRC